MGIISIFLKLGSVGDTVKYLQKKLIEFGHDLIVDGLFGEETEEVVKEVQKEKGLVVDGVVGPITAEAIGLQVIPSATRISKYEPETSQEIEKLIQETSKELGVEPEMIEAVADVESSGSGFLSDGRPKILFERHYMFRILQHYGHDAQLYSSIVPSIVNRNTGGYLGGEKEYIRLDFAKAIDEEIAYSSISIGGFQIMGSHYSRLGFNSSTEMYEYLSKGDKEQFEIFIKFIKTDPILMYSMKTKNFEKFARTYNGPNHKNYDLKIETAYNKLVKENSYA